MIRRRPSARLASSLAEQMNRKAELDEIRLTRPLTAEEQAEDDRLTHRLYMRQWRAGMADNGIRYDRRVNRPPSPPGSQGRTAARSCSGIPAGDGGNRSEDASADALAELT